MGPISGVRSTSGCGTAPMIRPARRADRRAYDEAPCRRPAACPRHSPRGSTRWSDILPLLVAEFVVWLGFGALLPVMPLYFREHGVDLATLGVVIAAWPAARLVGEPIFGWLADRVPRVPLMVAGNVGAGIFQFLPLVFVGPAAVPHPSRRSRACRPRSTTRPPAATSPTRPRPSGAARRSGCTARPRWAGSCFGPAIGGLGSAWFGGIGFVFVFGGISSFVAALRDRAAGSRDAGPRPASRRSLVRRRRSSRAGPRSSTTDRIDPADPARGAPPRRRASSTGCSSRRSSSTSAATSRPGTYDVVWSIFLDGLGAGLELIGFTFAMFGLPILLLSPYFGRRVDRGGIVWLVVIGGLAPALTGLLYPLIVDPVLAVPLILVEATGFAMLNPALFAMVAAGSPPGRSSTAQGIYGASGTMGFVVASLAAGALAEADIRLPFYVFAAVMFVSLGRRAWPSAEGAAAGSGKRPTRDPPPRGNR